MRVRTHARSSAVGCCGLVAHHGGGRSKELKYVRIKAQSMIVTFSIASFTSPIIMASITLPSFFRPYNTILQSGRCTFLLADVFGIRDTSELSTVWKLKLMLIRNYEVVPTAKAPR